MLPVPMSVFSEIIRTSFVFLEQEYGYSFSEVGDYRVSYGRGNARFFLNYIAYEYELQIVFSVGVFRPLLFDFSILCSVLLGSRYKSFTSYNPCSKETLLAAVVSLSHKVHCFCTLFHQDEKNTLRKLASISEEKEYVELYEIRKGNDAWNFKDFQGVVFYFSKVEHKLMELERKKLLYARNQLGGKSK